MRTKVQKWGNSLAVRIPKLYALEMGLEKESQVEVSVREGRLILTVAPPEPPSLDDLLAQITPQNRHAEVDFGEAVGAEAW